MGSGWGFAYPYYVARGGSSAKADEAISIIVDSITAPSALPCDRTIHGTMDATLVEQTAENIPGPGRETVHVVF